MNTKWRVLLLLVLGASCPVAAQPTDDRAGPSPTDRLAIQQGALADKYAKLEKLLDEMARIEAVSNPRRASLLLQALKQSKAELTAVKLNSSARLLNQQQLKQALDRQRDAYKDMQALLQLLLSENRSDRLKQEQERIREYIKEVERILRLQRSVQGRTEGGAEPRDLAQDQGKIANRTDQLAKRIQENEEGAGDSNQQDADQSDGDSKDAQGEEGEQEKAGEQGGENDDSPQEEPQDGESAEPGDKPGESDAEKPSDAPQEPGDNSESTEGQSGEGAQKKSGQGQPSGQGEPQPEQGEQGEQQDETPAEESNPARKRLQAAEEKMREAQKKLDEAKRNEALAEQEQAKEELERAKAELERILRQLREEEVERTLALLEGRFRKMLESQLRVYEDTKSLDKSNDELRKQKDSGELAVAERKLVVEADKALNLLLEEGSSIAFPETVMQLRDDMQQVADRLNAAKVSKITQAIEEDIIAALEDMIAALQKAQQDMEDQQQQEEQEMGEPGDMPLVDVLAELKMVRALQVRVNNRTTRYGELLDDADDPTGQATDAELRDALDKLAERQESIYKITRDLVLGKNK